MASNIITLTKPKKLRMPKALAKRIDALYAMRDERMAYGKKIKEAEKVLADLKRQEDEVAKDLDAEMRKAGGGLSKASGQVATFSPGLQDIYSVTDWDEFYAFIEKEHAFELLQKRPATTALNERRLNGVDVPGVHHDTKFSYSLTKAGKK